MILRCDRELANTKRKLRVLEECYAESEADSGGDEEVRKMELQSLGRLINQLKEEIARYEARYPASQ
jgi:hypothetical protein